MNTSNIIERLSPNFDRRADRQKPEMIIIHYTGMSTSEEALKRLCDPGTGVSAHYVIDERGTCFQLVDESNRAWHAGTSFWAGNSDINSCSIGIELCNPGHENGYRHFPEIQMRTFLRLGRDIVARQSILPHLVLGHSDVAPERKLDPGELFDWQRLTREGLGIWPATTIGTRKLEKRAKIFIETEDIARLQEKLARFGYGIEVTGKYDRRTNFVSTAFQRHFRQEKITTQLDEECEFILDNLLVILS